MSELEPENVDVLVEWLRRAEDAAGPGRDKFEIVLGWRRLAREIVWREQMFVSTGNAAHVWRAMVAVYELGPETFPEWIAEALMEAADKLDQAADQRAIAGKSLEPTETARIIGLASAGRGKPAPFEECDRHERDWRIGYRVWELWDGCSDPLPDGEQRFGLPKAYEICGAEFGVKRDMAKRAFRWLRDDLRLFDD